MNVLVTAHINYKAFCALAFPHDALAPFSWKSAWNVIRCSFAGQCCPGGIEKPAPRQASHRAGPGRPGLQVVQWVLLQSLLMTSSSSLLGQCPSRRFAKELKCLCQKANAEIIFSMLSENQEPESPTTVASDASDAES